MVFPVNIRSVSSVRVATFSQLMLSSALAGLVVLSPDTMPAFAQTAQGTKSFDIPAQSLSSALDVFAGQSGLSVTLAPDVARSLRSRPVKGNFSSAQALQTMLAGTDIPVRVTPNGQAVIGHVNAGGGIAADGSVVLAPILIDTGGSKGDVPSAYAGGQVATGSRVGLLGNKDVMSTPFSTVSYTKDYMENRQAKDIGSVIGATDPSIYVSNTSNIYETFYIRGFAGAADDVSYNGLIGMAPNMRGSTEFAERIEVLKGPSAFLNGMPPGGSVGGSVNIVPKRAQDDPITRLTTTYASDSQWGVHADFGRRFGANNEWGIRFNGVLRDGNTAIENEKHGMKIGSVALDWRGERARFSVDYYKQREDMDGVNYFGLSIAPGVKRLPRPLNGKHSLAAPWSFNKNDTDTVVLKGEYDITDAITAYASWGRRSGGYDSLITRNVLMDDNGTMAISGNRQVSDGTQYSGEIGLRGELATGSIDHEWNLSATRFTSKNTFTTLPLPNLALTNYYNIDFGPAPDVSAFANMGPYAGIEQKLTGVAFSDTMSLFDDRLQVTAGARYQRVENQQYLLPSHMMAVDYDESRVTPAVGVLYKATDNISVYANYIQGLSQGEAAPLGADNFGTVLKPYKTEQYEAGVKWDIGTITTTLSMFQISKPYAYVDPVTNLFGANGEQRNRGVELSVYGELASGLRMLGGISYIDAKLRDTANSAERGNKAPGTPSFMAKMGLEYDVAYMQGLTVTGNINHVGKRYVNNTNTLSVPSYTTLDLGLRYLTKVADKPLTLRASVLNVTNESYWGWSSLSGGLGKPRTFLLSASVDF
ncbi:TonB-dependent receptor [Brucella sp. TWI559]